MTSMEDLIATISGGMHVSQEGYDLKALQEYLSRTIVLPNVVSPGGAGAYGYAPGPSSRARSTTRKQSTLPPGAGLAGGRDPSSSGSFYSTSSAEYGNMDAAAMYQPYPSPIATVMEDHLPQPQRPASLRRSSSYGFGNMAGPSSPYMEYSSFDTDAFAPLVQGQESKAANMWGANADKGVGVGKPNPWTAFQSGGAFASQWAGKSSWESAHAPSMGHSGYRPPTPPDEDDEMMDEDEIEGQIDLVEEHEGQAGQNVAQRGLPGVDERIAEQMKQDWERGRRKQ